MYKENGSSGTFTQITINSTSTLKKVVTGLDKYTEYEFQVLAFTAVGDGPANKKTKRTKEDGEETELYTVLPISFCLEAWCFLLEN